MRAFAFAAAAVVACSGGSDTGTTDGGGTTSGSSSGGGSSSSGSTTSTCSEVHVGGTNDPAIGGAASSQVIAQSVSDLGGVAAKQVTDLTATCKSLATALGASSSAQASADGNTDELTKLNAWCQLAVSTMGASKAKAAGTIQVEFDPPKCKLSVATKAACQGRCTGSTTPCDTTANPMKCTGGTLANGFCEGGKLEGGCPVDAKCDAACDATTIAGADCPSPTVTVTITGAVDAAEAAKLKAAFEANMPASLSMKEKCTLEANIVGTFTGTVSAVTDIKPACIPPLVKATSTAASEIQACASASVSVAGQIGN